MAQLKGIVVPIITPMNEDETINEQELRNQVNRMIENGISGIRHHANRLAARERIIGANPAVSVTVDVSG